MAVFRRGPSKQVALLERDLLTNRVALGQWLKGLINVRRVDLSPDGRHLIYFASNYRPGSDVGGTWTAVSRLPDLRALHLYGWGHSWNGGGLFIDNTTYWLNEGGRARQGSIGLIACRLRASDAPPDGVTPAMGQDPMTYIPRLMRDGWKQVGHGPDGPRVIAATFEKRIRAGWVLEKRFRMGVHAGPLDEMYHDVHRLIGFEGPVEFAAERAEVWKHELRLATAGCLWRQRVHAKGLEDAVQVADLNDTWFKAIEARYASVGRADLRASV